MMVCANSWVVWPSRCLKSPCASSGCPPHTKQGWHQEDREEDEDDVAMPECDTRDMMGNGGNGGSDVTQQGLKNQNNYCIFHLSDAPNKLEMNYGTG